MDEERGLLLAKIFGILFIIVGLGLLLIAVLQVTEIPQLEIPEIEKLKTYLGSVGALNLGVYGILALILGVGLIKEEEWAAGGSFVLLLIVIVNLSAYVWYWIQNFGTENLPFAVIASIITVAISVLILLYLIWARGWK